MIAEPQGATALFLKVSEAVQVGDTYLIKFVCPACNERPLTYWKSPICDYCETDFADHILYFPETRSNWRLVTGTKRKCSNRISKKLVQAIFQMQEGLCAYCGQDLRESNYHVEHIIPLSFGGTNNHSNLCLACPKCNLIAGSLVFPDFYEKRDYIISRRFQKAGLAL